MFNLSAEDFKGKEIGFFERQKTLLIPALLKKFFLLPKAGKKLSLMLKTMIIKNAIF